MNDVSRFNLNYIANRRKELKLTSEDMAKALGFSNGSVYWKYEHGVYKLNADILPLLAKALKCKISYFYTP
nr:MAG TPA: Helix-turn-helix XRE-family like protein [Caudoviricetes sp.]